MGKILLVVLAIIALGSLAILIANNGEISSDEYERVTETRSLYRSDEKVVSLIKQCMSDNVITRAELSQIETERDNAFKRIFKSELNREL